MNPKLFITAAVVACAAHASATDVFAYLAGNFKPVAEMGEIRKIVNNSETTTLISEKGDSVMIENAAFTYLTFHRTSVPTGIGSAKAGAKAAVVVSYSDGVVRVTAPQPLRRISIVSADGSEVGRVESPTADAVISTYGLPAGVYIVSATTADGKHVSKKIVKK